MSGTPRPGFFAVHCADRAPPSVISIITFVIIQSAAYRCYTLMTIYRYSIMKWCPHAILPMLICDVSLHQPVFVCNMLKSWYVLIESFRLTCPSTITTEGSRGMQI